MEHTHPVAGWLFPLYDEEDSGPTIEQMATELAELEAPFPSEQYDQAVGEYLIMDEYDLLHTYRTRIG